MTKIEWCEFTWNPKSNDLFRYLPERGKYLPQRGIKHSAYQERVKRSRLINYYRKALDFVSAVVSELDFGYHVSYRSRGMTP
jgi:hypothetical protein